MLLSTYLWGRRMIVMGILQIRYIRIDLGLLSAVSPVLKVLKLPSLCCNAAFMIFYRDYLYRDTTEDNLIFLGFRVFIVFSSCLPKHS